MGRYPHTKRLVAIGFVPDRKRGSMGIDLTTQAALSAHRESSVRSATPELLLGESRDELLATTSRIARAAESEGSRNQNTGTERVL